MLKDKLENRIKMGLDRNEISSDDLLNINLNDFYNSCKIIKSFIKDSFPILFNKSSRNILIEGAQGTLLDIDHGTFPYVTSS